MPVAKRKTQAQRREGTIARLVDATIAQLADRGYAQLTVASVCERAALSQGALFRHFGSRAELIAAATEEVCRRHLTLIAAGFVDAQIASDRSALKELVLTLRAAARTPEHAAWHEVMVAARTDATLHALVAPSLKGFEQSILAAIDGVGGTPSARVGTVLLSVMHMLDSEAVTVAVYPNAPIEADRIEWLVELLARELAA